MTESTAIVDNLTMQHTKNIETVPRGYWKIKKNCAKEALKYNSKSTLSKCAAGAYDSMKRHGWVKELCSHMKETKRPNGYWTKENCKKEALKFSTKKDFEMAQNGAYCISVKNGWIKEICSHMKTLVKPKGYWTLAKCSEIASGYNHRIDFATNSRKAYVAAQRRGILDDICSHMTPLGNLAKRLIYAFEFDDNSAYVGLTCNANKRIWGHLNSTSYIIDKVRNGTNYNVLLLTDYIDAIAASTYEQNYIDGYAELGWTILNKRKGGGLGGFSRKISN